MSGPRHSLHRPHCTVGLAGVALWFCALSSCTMPTPDYCDDRVACPMGKTCDDHHFCKSPVDIDATSDGRLPDLASDMRVPTDGGADVAPDAPADTTGDTTSLGDAAGDRRDAMDVPPPTCVSTPSLCSGARPVCDTTNATCVECLRNDDCHSTTAPACDTGANAKKCVQCVQSTDCKSAVQPVCENQLCRACRADSDCTGVGPEVCMLDGHCAIDDETVYVRNGVSPSCSDTVLSSGTKTLPFCRSQPAIAAALQPPLPADAGAPDAGTPDSGRTDAGAPDGGVADGAAADGAALPDTRAHTLKTLVVMLGPTNPLTELAFDGGSRTLTIVGKNATIGPAAVGITVTSGILYVRDLSVTTSGTFTGVVATGGQIHLDRMVIRGNMAGGVLIDGASFDITNSVIAQNGESLFPNTVITWSGIAMGAVPANGPARLVDNTITGNGTGGVACVDATANRVGMNGLLFWANTRDNLGCTEVPCCVDGNNARINPGFDTTNPYHLTAASMCRGKVPASFLPPPFDIDGQPRPVGVATDCGADQYLPPTP